MPAIGDTLETDDIMHLPIGAVVADVQGDTSEKLDDDKWQRNDGYQIKDTGPSGYFNKLFTPYTLASLPVDLYQEARLALRDVLGMDPDEQMIRNTMDTARPLSSMDEAAKLIVGAAKLAQGSVAEVANEKTRPNLVAGFGIAVSGGGFAAAATVDTDDTVNGLARLRAHAALDALLDQHGISR